MITTTTPPATKTATKTTTKIIKTTTFLVCDLIELNLNTNTNTKTEISYRYQKTLIPEDTNMLGGGVKIKFLLNVTK